MLNGRAVDDERAPSLHRDPAGARFHRAHAREGRDRPDWSAPRPISATQYGARVRLTGPVAIADEEYATLQEGAFVNTTLTIVVVLTILWLALRSFGIILAVFISLLVGLFHHGCDRIGPGGRAQPDFGGLRRPTSSASASISGSSSVCAIAPSGMRSTICTRP